MAQGFIKLNRQAGIELLEEHPKAFLLLTQIALRARRTDVKYSRHSLKANQAFVGDHEKIGLSKQEYRNAKKRLEKYGLVHFEPKNKGTIATLTSLEVYDINADELQSKEPTNFSIEKEKEELSKNKQKTSKKHSKNHCASTEEQLTRMKEEKEHKEETTTAVGKGAALYECLQKASNLDLEKKQSLMVYPENRVRMALEWSSKTAIKKTLIGALHWHCKQSNPPISTELPVGQNQQQIMATEYNQFLDDHGFTDLSAKNYNAISEQYVHVILEGRSTTISLNNPADLLKKEFNISKKEILDNESKRYNL